MVFPSFYIFLHFLYIHSPDDGSAEPKHSSVDFFLQ